jgi:hypothetical protein
VAFAEEEAVGRELLHDALGELASAVEVTGLAEAPGRKARRPELPWQGS